MIFWRLAFAWNHFGLYSVVSIWPCSSIHAFNNTFLKIYLQRAQLMKRCHHLFKDATLFGGGVEIGGQAEKENNNISKFN